MKQLCRQGVEAVEYPSGKVDTAETAVRRAVLTGVNQTAAKLREALADEGGCDLVELSPPKYEYQGEKFTEYEARQKEKYFDRQITRWQREAEAMKAAGQDPAEAQAKVKAWERRNP